jgi:hypothetical protein
MALKLKMKTAATKTAAVKATGGGLGTAEATAYRALALEMDELKTKMAVARDELMEVVAPERERKMKAGEEVSSVKVPTDDGNRVLVVYTEKFKHLDAENVDALKEAFGEDYALMCEEHEAVTFAKGTSLSAIESAIGSAAFKKLSALLNVRESVTPRKGASKLASRFYRDGETEKGDDALMFLDATLYSPQVRAK